MKYRTVEFIHDPFYNEYSLGLPIADIEIAVTASNMKVNIKDIESIFKAWKVSPDDVIFMDKATLFIFDEDQKKGLINMFDKTSKMGIDK